MLDNLFDIVFFYPFLSNKKRFLRSLRLMLKFQLKIDSTIGKFYNKNIIENHSSFQQELTKQSPWMFAISSKTMLFSTGFIEFYSFSNVSLGSYSISDSRFNIEKQSMSENIFTFES